MAFTRPKAAQIDFDITNITDPLIRLNSGETGSADKDVGIVVERGSDTNVAIIWDESADQFVLVNTTETGTTSGNVTIASYAGVRANAIVYGSLNDGTTTLTATAAELNYADGVTSNIQTQIDGKINTTGNNTITSTTSGSSAAPEFELFRDITGADANYIGQIKFSADNDANQKTVFAKITGKIGDASDGTEDGILEIAHVKAGSNNINVRMTSTEFKIMNGTDFDVETHDGSSAGLRLGNTLVTATAAELNILDGVTATAAEINRVDGIGSAAVGLTDTQTLTNKTLTSPQITTDIRLNAQAELEFYDSDSSHYVAFRAPATVASSLTWTLPATDGTANQVLETDGAGTLGWADAGSGGGSGSSFPNSTFQTVPGTNGNFDLAKNVAQTVTETPFEASGTDAFGVNLGSVFSLMDPVGTTDSIDYGSGESHVGA